MKAIALLFLLVPALAWADAPPVRPLLDERMTEGTVSVQVVKGTMERPIGGVLLTLAGKKTRSARTDGLGRANFSGLAVGATYKVEAKVGDSELLSEEFTMPKGGGVRVLFSPVPLEASAMAGGGVPGENADAPTEGAEAESSDDLPPMMRDPRRLSGQARPEAQDPAGSLTVRAVQGKFKKTEAGLVSDFPKGTPVVLVGFSPAGAVTFAERPLDDSGRARFDKLAKDGTAYYALSLFARKNGIIDRLASPAIQMLPGVGLRMMFAGLGVDDDAPAVDDTASERGGQQPPAGEVQVVVQVVPEKLEHWQKPFEVELVRASAKGEEVVMKAPGRASLQSDVVPVQAEEMELKNGALGIGVFQPSQKKGLGDVAIELRRAGDKSRLPLAQSKTEARGFIVFSKELEAISAKQVVAVVNVFGREVVSKPFALPKKNDPGVGFVFVVDEQSQGTWSATFEGVPESNASAYFARIKKAERTYRSVPFQLPKTVGAQVFIREFGNFLFAFAGSGEMEDDRMWFSMQVNLENLADTPFVPENGQIVLPLPKGFLAGSIQAAEGMEEENTGPAKIVPGVGVAWRGPLAPGSNTTSLQFAVPVEDGRAVMDWPLPYGLAMGQLMFVDVPNMGLKKLADENDRNGEEVKRKTHDGKNGVKLVAIGPYQIPAGQRFVLGIDNLPQRSGWERGLRVATGLGVIAFLLWGLGTALFRPRPHTQGIALRDSENTMDDLVKLETQKQKGLIEADAYAKEREVLLKRLEVLRREEQKA